MTLSARLVSSLATVLLLATACGQPPESKDSSPSTQPEQVSTPVPAEIQALTQSPTVMMCDHNTAPGVMHCYARKRTDIAPQGISPNLTPSGLGPTDIQSAYKLPTTGGAGLTVAIVDANDDPTAEADLATYRSTYGLPACTTANGCFKKVNQDGNASPLPAKDTGWAGEIALDLDMVSAACPTCKILLVEANTADMDNLGAAVNSAARLGAVAISNSYGGSEDSTIATADSQYFNHPGVTITVSSGDDGYGVEYPASSQYVTAVGGTSLTRSTGTSRGWVESVWGSASNTNGGAGSGCSAYITKPTWQKDTGCAKRMVADVSAVADPNTGVAVYDTTGGTGWAVYGGTSASSPLVAAIYTLTGHASTSLGYSYSTPGAYFDVTSGTNGSCTGSTYQCKAGTGYDGPTGNGTPNGAVLAGGTPTNDFSVSLTPSSRSTAQGTTTTFTVATALVGGTAQTVTLAVSGLPTGVTGAFSPASVTAGGSSTLTLTVASSAAAATTSFTVSGSATSGSHSTSGSLTVTGTGGTCSTNSQLLLNPGFESGNTTWTTSSGVISTTTSSSPSHTGTYLAYLDGYGTATTDTAYQTLTIPAGACTASFSFWLRINTSETTTTTAYDTLSVQIQNSSGTSLATLATYSNLNKSSSYAQKTFDLSAYKGQTIRVYFKGVEDSTQATSFLIDDTAVNITQ